MRYRLLLVAVLALLAVVPVPAQQGFVVLKPASAAAIINGTTTVATLQIGTTAGLGLASMLLNVTTTGTATGTLQVYIQDSADGGVTWDDLASSNTFAFGAAITTQRFFVTSDLLTTATQGTAVSVDALAAGTVRSGPYGDRLRVREKISSIGGSPVGPVYTVTAVFK